MSPRKSSRFENSTHTVFVPGLKLGGAIGAVWSQNRVPIVQLIYGYIVVLRENEAIVASCSLDIFATSRDYTALGRVS